MMVYKPLGGSATHLVFRASATRVKSLCGRTFDYDGNGEPSDTPIGCKLCKRSA